MLGTLLVVADLWKIYILFWVIPQFTLLVGLLELRSLTEHIGLSNDENQSKFQTRSVNAGLIESFLLNPHNTHFHLEHHLYPSVPRCDM